LTAPLYSSHSVQALSTDSNMYGLVLDIEVTMAYVEAEEEVYEYDDPLEFEIEQLKDEAGSSIVLS